MDSLFKILSQKDFEEPPEILAIKKYVRELPTAPAELSGSEHSIENGG